MKIIKIIGIWLVSMFTVLIFTYFIQGNVNVLEWENSTRFLMVVLTLALFIGVAIIADDEDLL